MEICPSGGLGETDPETGRTTPAAIGPGQVRRKLCDCASFTVRMQ
jgi:hypothetical protein